MPESSWIRASLRLKMSSLIFEKLSECMRYDALLTKLSALQSPNDDLQALFLEYADPAFNRFLLDG